MQWRASFSNRSHNNHRNHILFFESTAHLTTPPTVLSPPLSTSPSTQHLNTTTQHLNTTTLSTTTPDPFTRSNHTPCNNVNSLMMKKKWRRCSHFQDVFSGATTLPLLPMPLLPLPTPIPAATLIIVPVLAHSFQATSGVTAKTAVSLSTTNKTASSSSSRLD